MAEEEDFFDDDFCLEFEDKSAPDDPKEETEVKQETSSASTSKLTEYQRARAEKNRLKALQLRKAKLAGNPYQIPEEKRKINIVTGEKLPLAEKEKKLVDSGAGFFIEEDEDENETEAVKELPAPIIIPDRPSCKECNKDFPDSFLFRTFDFSVCDGCQDTERDGKHELITKTEAKNTFLLKDFDLEKREPELKFIVRKNPHNSRWGDMKLFLRVQVERRALEVWESEENLEREHQKREEKKEAAKSKKFNKKIKELRMQVRGSLYKKDLSVHEHEFGDENFDEEADEYFKTCKTCNFTQRYEKM